MRGKGGAPGDSSGYYNQQTHRFVPLSKKSTHHKERFAIFVVLGSLLLLFLTALGLRSRYSLRQWRNGDDSSPSFRAGVAAAKGPSSENAHEAGSYGLSDQWIETNPDIKGGEPVIRGTRLSVRAVAQRIDHGDTIEILTEDYPDIPAEAFQTAYTYARRSL